MQGPHQPAPATVAPPPPPFPGQSAPLPPFWTEHKAPAGQAYWYNSQTSISTYTRPVAPPPPPGFSPYAPGSLPPHYAPATPAALPPLHYNQQNNALSTLSVEAEIPAKKEKKEKPKTKTVIGETPWTRVVTNKGNTFYTNRETKESVWSVPGEIRELVDALELEENGGAKKRKAEDSEEAVEEIVEDVPIDSIEVDAPVTKEEEKIEEVVPPPSKKKKVKKAVVRDIEELEGDEDWQRQIAAQMAEEVAAAERAEEALRTGEEVAAAPIVEPIAPQPERMDISPEEGAALFKAMLADKDISPMAPWDTELPKFINDSRYSAVRGLKDRRDIFDEFCKEKLRLVRLARKAALDAAGGAKADPLTAYRELLTTAVTSTRMHFSDFKKMHQKEPRFREFGKTEGEREKVFKSFLRELGEKKRAQAEDGERKFAAMLKEAGVTDGKWAEVKTRFASESRYIAITSSSLRESLYNKYLANLSSAASTPAASTSGPSGAEAKAARAAASLRERENQVRGEKMRTTRNTELAKGALGREEEEREFSTLLVDTVRDHEARWESVSSLLSRDSRFNTSSISAYDKRRLFDNHLSTLYKKRLAAVTSLFLGNAPLLTTPFHEIVPSIITSPHVLRLVGPSPTQTDQIEGESPQPDLEKLENHYIAWTIARTQQARAELIELLKENPVLEHWGRLQKKDDHANAEGGMKDGGAEDDEDAGSGDDEILGLKEMAMQVNLKAVEAVLKHDKRYLIFNHVPDDRSNWIAEFIATLSAHRATVHQRD